MTLQVRESQIEDALVGAGEITRRLLGLKEEPHLLGRQIGLPSGRLDLLYAYRAKLLLLELKVVRFKREFLGQVAGYRRDLQNQQQKGALLRGDIETHLLCPEAAPGDEHLAQQREVRLTRYDPREVLDLFYQNFRPVAFYAEAKPIDIGVWNVHLIHGLIYELEKTNSLSNLRKIPGFGTRTLRHKILFASELRLIDRSPHRDDIALTELGKQYAAAKNAAIPGRLSDEQAQLLSQLIMRNPYESSVILGIAAVVETAFMLSKNTHPVPMEQLISHFPAFAGKLFDWKTPKAQFNGTRMYSNYAVDLGLLAKTQNSVYLTPEGFRFTLQMQMHKNLKMTESLRPF